MAAAGLVAVTALACTADPLPAQDRIRAATSASELQIVLHPQADVAPALTVDAAVPVDVCSDRAVCRTVASGEPAELAPTDGLSHRAWTVTVEEGAGLSVSIEYADSDGFVSAAADHGEVELCVDARVDEQPSNVAYVADNPPTRLVVSSGEREVELDLSGSRFFPLAANLQGDDSLPLCVTAFGLAGPTAIFLD